MELYDRIPGNIHSIHVRGNEINQGDPDSNATSNSVVYPAFALARTAEREKPDFQLSWPVKSYDVMNRYRLVHVSYAYEQLMGVLVAVAMDDLGEAREIGWWKINNDEGDSEVGDGADAKGIVGRVWEWCRITASAWVAEYRLSICKFGLINVEELKSEWNQHS